MPEKEGYCSRDDVKYPLFKTCPMEARNNKGWRYEMFFWDDSKGTVKVTMVHRYNGGAAVFFDNALLQTILPIRNPFGGDAAIMIKKEYIPGDHTILVYAHENGSDGQMSIKTTITKGWEYGLTRMYVDMESKYVPYKPSLSGSDSQIADRFKKIFKDAT